jgi:hypothetical protein
MSSFRSGGFSGGMGGFSGGFSSGFSGSRGMGGTFSSGFRGTRGSFGHVPAAPTSGRWNNFGHNNGHFHNGHFDHGDFNHVDRFHNRFFFAGFWGIGPWWWDGYPWWYADVGYGDYSNPYCTDSYLYGGYDYAAPIQQNPESAQDDAALPLLAKIFTPPATAKR